jgi:hypothetical protein
MNILIIIRCWLRETFAHADFKDEEMIVSPLSRRPLLFTAHHLENIK